VALRFVESAEGVFDGLAAYSRSLWCAVQPFLHRLEHVFVLPTGDASVLVGRALRFDRALKAC
jgi:hypothetical protein